MNLLVWQLGVAGIAAVTYTVAWMRSPTHHKRALRLDDVAMFALAVVAALTGLVIFVDGMRRLLDGEGSVAFYGGFMGIVLACVMSVKAFKMVRTLFPKRATESAPPDQLNAPSRIEQQVSEEREKQER